MMDAPGEHVPRFMATSLVDLASRLENGRSVRIFITA